MASKSKDKDVKEFGAWSEQTSSSGRKYFYNKETEVSQWEKPKEWRDHEIQQEQERLAAEQRMQPPPPPPQPPMFLTPPPFPFSPSVMPPPFPPGFLNTMDAYVEYDPAFDQTYDPLSSTAPPPMYPPPPSGSGPVGAAQFGPPPVVPPPALPPPRINTAVPPPIVTSGNSGGGNVPYSPYQPPPPMHQNSGGSGGGTPTTTTPNYHHNNGSRLPPGTYSSTTTGGHHHHSHGAPSGQSPYMGSHNQQQQGMKPSHHHQQHSHHHPQQQANNSNQHFHQPHQQKEYKYQPKQQQQQPSASSSGDVVKPHPYAIPQPLHGQQHHQPPAPSSSQYRPSHQNPNQPQYGYPSGPPPFKRENSSPGTVLRPKEEARSTGNGTPNMVSTPSVDGGFSRDDERVRSMKRERETSATPPDTKALQQQVKKMKEEPSGENMVGESTSTPVTPYTGPAPPITTTAAANQQPPPAEKTPPPRRDEPWRRFYNADLAKKKRAELHLEDDPELGDLALQSLVLENKLINELIKVKQAAAMVAVQEHEVVLCKGKIVNLREQQKAISERSQMVNAQSSCAIPALNEIRRSLV